MKPKLKPLKKFTGDTGLKPVLPSSGLKPATSLKTAPLPEPQPMPESPEVQTVVKPTITSPGLKPKLPITSPGLKPKLPITSPGLKPKLPITSPGLKPKLPITSPGLKPKLPITSPGLKPVSPKASLKPGIIIPMSPSGKPKLSTPQPEPERQRLKPLTVKGLEGISVRELKPITSPETKKKGKIVKLPSNLEPAVDSLSEAQEGLKTAKLAEPEAFFQPKLALKKLPSMGESPKKKVLSPKPKSVTLKTLSFDALSEEIDDMTVVASSAKLPTQKLRGAPKIKIPKIQASPVRPLSPATSKIKGVKMPSQTTAVAPIAVTSPIPIRSRVVSASIPEQELNENIKLIDTTKLKADRKGKDAYSVVELKTIAGSLNLTKGGSKKDLVERIKTAILRVNPSAEFP